MGGNEMLGPRMSASLLEGNLMKANAKQLNIVM